MKKLYEETLCEATSTAKGFDRILENQVQLPDIVRRAAEHGKLCCSQIASHCHNEIKRLNNNPSETTHDSRKKESSDAHVLTA